MQVVARRSAMSPAMTLTVDLEAGYSGRDLSDVRAIADFEHIASSTGQQHGWIVPRGSID
jgi:hypothetical protein